MLRWAAAVVAVLAIGEAAYIGRLLLRGSSDRSQRSVTAVPSPPRITTPTNDRPRLTPLQTDTSLPPPTSALPTLALASAGTPGADLRATSAIKDAAAQAGRSGARPGTPAVPQRSGGFRISAPVELHVLDGERLLGSSADGPIIAAAGRHEFEFVNSAIGYRASRVVDVKAGEITSVSVTVPNGTLNVNATPWAAVFIDGMPYGETPLGNLSIAAGEHEVVFRHPQFGERRERATVRTQTITRVAVNFR
jgi:PEGA domain